MQTQLWEKPIYKLLSCFGKQHILSRLFTRIFFLGKRKPIKHLKIFYFGHHSPACNCSHKCHLLPVSQMSSQFWYAEVGSRYSLLIYCKILNSQLLLQWCCFKCGGLQDRCRRGHESGVLNLLLWSHNFNYHFNPNRSSCPEMFCKKSIPKNFVKFTGKQNHSLIDFTYLKDCVCLMIS